MSKLSRTFTPPSGSGIGVRLTWMSVILVVVFVVLIAVRSGMLNRPAGPGTPEAATPTQTPSGTGPLQARVSTTPAGVQLQLSEAAPATDGTPEPSPSPPTTHDNTTHGTPGTDNDLFANVLDGHEVRWAERDAYHHVVAMAWDLGRKGTTEQPLQLKQLELLADPKSCRTKLIRVKGSLLRVRRRTFDPDEKRPDRPPVHYECAVKSVDEDPYIVLVFEDPSAAGVQAGRDVVWTDAYFFKIWGYNDAKRSAPLLMGYRVHKLKSRNVLGPVASVVLGGFVALVILLWLWLRRGRYQSEMLRRRLAREDAEEVDIPEPGSLPPDETRPS